MKKLSFTRRFRERRSDMRSGTAFLSLVASNGTISFR